MLRDVARAEAHDTDYARGIARLEMAGLTVFRVADPTGQDGRSRKDADDFARAHGLEALRALIDAAELAERSVEGEALKIAALADAAARDQALRAAAKELGVGVKALAEKVQKLRRKSAAKEREDEVASAPTGMISRQPPFVVVRREYKTRRRHGARARASTSRIPGRTAVPRSRGSARCSRWSGSTAPPTPRTGAFCSGSPTPIRWCTSGPCRRACWPAAAMRCAPSCLAWASRSARPRRPGTASPSTSKPGAPSSVTAASTGWAGTTIRSCCRGRSSDPRRSATRCCSSTSTRGTSQSSSRLARWMAGARRSRRRRWATIG